MRNPVRQKGKVQKDRNYKARSCKSEPMLAFQKAPDSENLTYRHKALLHTGEVVEIGVWRVLFGLRVRAGYVGAGSCNIDWCCGASPTTLNYIYKLLMNILTARMEEKISPGQFFQGIASVSAIKPVNLDQAFMAHITSFPQKSQTDITIQSFQK